RRQYGCDFISAMPSNLYGPNDNYDLKNSHVIPALIEKFRNAKENKIESVDVWGTGNPKREFLHVEDLGDACFFLMKNYSELGFINVGSGIEITIRDLAFLIAEIADFKGKINFDTSKPDGTPRKLLDVSKIKKLGWSAKIHLKQGIQSVYHRQYVEL
ncbi:MAG: NAD-dependent epimerase/dehydratase family protein, partial [Cyclobacteriaceae bacterium]